jgi:hypothetical protein
MENTTSAQQSRFKQQTTEQVNETDAFARMWRWRFSNVAVMRQERVDLAALRTSGTRQMNCSPACRVLAVLATTILADGMIERLL